MANSKTRNWIVPAVCVGALLLLVPVAGLVRSSPDGVANVAPAMAAACTTGRSVSGKFYPRTDEIAFYTGPRTSDPKIVNAQASKNSGDTDYRTLDRDVVLQGICATDDWLQAKIVEADGAAVDWETGWVQTQFVSATPSSDQAAGFLWSIDKDSGLSASNRRLLHEGALKILKGNSNCGSISFGYLNPAKSPRYVVECNGHGSSFKVYFSAADVTSGKSLAPPAPIPGEIAGQMCENAVLTAATHPSTVHFHIFGGAQGVDPATGDRKILRQFDARNGFGLELNYAALCAVTPAGKLKLAINETR